jgi:hypothetical protein
VLAEDAVDYWNGDTSEYCACHYSAHNVGQVVNTHDNSAQRNDGSDDSPENDEWPTSERRENDGGKSC